MGPFSSARACVANERSAGRRGRRPRHSRLQSFLPTHDHGCPAGSAARFGVARPIRNLLFCGLDLDAGSRLVRPAATFGGRRASSREAASASPDRNGTTGHRRLGNPGRSATCRRRFGGDHVASPARPRPGCRRAGAWTVSATDLRETAPSQPTARRTARDTDPGNGYASPHRQEWFPNLSATAAPTWLLRALVTPASPKCDGLAIDRCRSTAAP